VYRRGRFSASRNAVGQRRPPGGETTAVAAAAIAFSRRRLGGIFVIASVRQSAFLLFASPDEDPEERLVHVRRA